MDNNKILSKKSEDIYKYLQSVRRQLHSNPELSFVEYKTSEYIRNVLDELKISYDVYLGTGIAAYIGNGDNCVALRADIDALPIAEETGLDYQSLNNGVMHACGHDLHTAMLLGAARILKEIENELEGTVMLIFQPGEEKLPGGAKLMIEAGLFNKIKPKAIFGQHVNPEDNSGTISINSNYIMASADELYWTIRGKGAHAAQPHKGNDPITAAAEIIIQLQTFINKNRNPIEPAVLTVTSIHGGTATNIIPEEVRMMGTFRTFNNEWRFTMLKKIKSLSENIAENNGCSVEFVSPEGYPPVFNDNETTQFATDTAVVVFGQENVLNFEPKMWAEDFANYTILAGIPSTFWFLGIGDKGRENPGLHHPKFYPDESAMIKGTELLCSVAYNYLNKK